MTLLDRFRAQSRDKHSDPAVRLTFVEELPLSEKEAIAAAAREDDDPRVRKAAVAKLMDPATLAAVLRDDKDENVPGQASLMLRDIALEAFEEVARGREPPGDRRDHRTQNPVPDCKDRHARGVGCPGARSRITDVRALGSIARHAALEPIRMSAFAAVREQGAHDEVLAVAMNSDFKDTALAALELVTDRAELDQVIARGRNKSAAKRARTIMREAEEQATRAKPPRGRGGSDRSGRRRTAGCGGRTRSRRPHRTAIRSAPCLGTRRRPPRCPAPAEPEAPSETDEERAAREADAAGRAPGERERRAARLAELAAEAEAAVADENLPAARKRFNDGSPRME